MSEVSVTRGSTIHLEFSEHVERIENSLESVGDFFLAKMRGTPAGYHR